MMSILGIILFLEYGLAYSDMIHTHLIYLFSIISFLYFFIKSIISYVFLATSSAILLALIAYEFSQSNISLGSAGWYALIESDITLYASLAFLFLSVSVFSTRQYFLASRNTS